MKSIRWLVALCALVLLAPLAPAQAQSIDPATGAMKVYCVSSTCNGGGGGSSYTVTGGAAGTPANLFTPVGGSDGTFYQMFRLDPTSHSLLVQDSAVLAAVQAPVPTQAPTVDIGATGISQTTPGTTNAVVVKAFTAGGATPGVTAALTNTAVAIKASAGTLYKVRCYNPNATAVSVQIYNIASGSVTVGTSTAVDIVTIAATSSGGWRAGAVGDAYSTAISYAATTTPTGSTAPGTALSCAYAYN